MSVVGLSPSNYLIVCDILTFTWWLAKYVKVSSKLLRTSSAHFYFIITIIIIIIIFLETKKKRQVNKKSKKILSPPVPRASSHYIKTEKA